jgi:hypothetical protein
MKPDDAMSFRGKVLITGTLLSLAVWSAVIYVTMRMI